MLIFILIFCFQWTWGTLVWNHYQLWGNFNNTIIFDACFTLHTFFSNSNLKVNFATVRLLLHVFCTVFFSSHFSPLLKEKKNDVGEGGGKVIEFFNAPQSIWALLMIVICKHTIFVMVFVVYILLLCMNKRVFESSNKKDLLTLLVFFNNECCNLND